MFSPAPGLATDIESLDARLLAGCMKVRFYPLVIRRQRGNRMWDEAGSDYLDFTSGWSVAAVGYGHPKVIEAVTRQFSETSFASTVSALNEPSVRLAQRLVDLVPGSYSKKVWFGLSGSDATETLGKMVPLATGRPKLISFIGGYHGMTGMSAAMTGHQTTARLQASGNVIKIPYPDPYLARVRTQFVRARAGAAGAPRRLSVQDDRPTGPGRRHHCRSGASR